MLGLLNFKKTKSVYREVKNYLYILSVIDKNKSTDLWKNRHRLRFDWIGRIYTVLSLREEDLGEQEEVKKFKVMQKMSEVNTYLTSLGLQEILVPTVKPIDNSRSYLVVYAPYFSQLSYTWMGWNIFFPIALILQFLA